MIISCTPRAALILIIIMSARAYFEKHVRWIVVLSWSEHHDQIFDHDVQSSLQTTKIKHYHEHHLSNINYTCTMDMYILSLECLLLIDFVSPSR